ncbi:MFS transporter [Pseudomonas sp. TH31]|uniref:MFS transporter n=1 Tax=Pseudomonas sp. TH31 TaxID=2796396 RepID=UPI001913760A|nr:aromatic acid/H+ symport family MFS transporter [Pseudomonas sp. TH31]MBK5413287.1 aromatic acid/H+ symport family MFS transporter [Pseudomonas sp. TH31]
MSTLQSINVDQLINARPMSRLQWRIVVLCFLVIALDGFDAAIMGFIAPELAREWAVSKLDLGPVMSAALIGVAIGALIAGPLADRLGRKPVLICAVAFFGALTLASAFAPNLEWMEVLRLLAGLGLGAAMPNAGTLVSEYTPLHRRSMLITLVLSGFTFGAAAGGFTSAYVIPLFGWQSVMLIGGLLPLLALPLLIAGLPESLRWLVTRRPVQSQQGSARIMQRLAPELANDQTRFTIDEVERPRASPVGRILSKGFFTGTLLLWLTYFMGLFLVYLLGSWLPTLIKDNGLSVSDAALITALFQFGGTFGSLFLGWFIDRRNPHHTLALTYLLGGLAIFLIGTANHGFALFAVLAAAAGFCMNGGNACMYALSANFYPTPARATGVSWMRGIGGLGSIASGFAGAHMLGAGWSFDTVFAALAVPALIAGIAVFIKGSLTQPAGLAQPHSSLR